MLVVDGKDSQDVLDVDEEVPHRPTPRHPPGALLQAQRVDGEVDYLHLFRVDREGQFELLRVLDLLQL